MMDEPFFVEINLFLCNFYRRARPLGLWGPIRNAALAEEGVPAHAPALRLLLAGSLLGVLGAVWIAAAVLGLSQLAVGRCGNALVLGIISLVGAAVFRPLFHWHIQRMEDSQLAP